MSSEQLKEIVIYPKGQITAINFAELWEYRDLLKTFVRRDLITAYQQTILGPLWYVIQPIATTIVFVVIFGRIAQINTGKIPQPIFYLSGIILWNYFQECLLRSSSTFIGNAGLFGKVYFPRLVVPLSQVTSGAIKAGIQFALFYAVYAYYKLEDPTFGQSWHLNIFTPFLLIPLATISLGLGIAFSALTTKYRDLNFLLAFAVQLLMYGTPIIYPTNQAPESIRNVLWWNPISHIVDAFRFCAFGTEFDLLGLAYTTAFAIVSITIGSVVFNQTARSFADTV